MGRSRKMEFIGDRKSRIATLKKREKGLIKQLEQLTTLCDVPACMIINDSTANSTTIWPPNDPDCVRRLIDGCKDPSSVRRYGVADFFKERQKQVEGEIANLRRKNLEGMDEFLSSLDEAQLRELAATLRAKEEAVRSRIQFLKWEEESVMMVKKNDDVISYSDSADQGMTSGFMDLMKENLLEYSDSTHIGVQGLIFMEPAMKMNDDMISYSDSVNQDMISSFMDLRKDGLLEYSDSTYIGVQDQIFMEPMKKNDDVLNYSDLDQFSGIDQDMESFMEPVMNNNDNVINYSDSDQFYGIDQHMESFMEVLGSNTYAAPPLPLPLLHPNVGYNYYSSMDMNHNNCSSMEVMGSNTYAVPPPPLLHPDVDYNYYSSVDENWCCGSDDGDDLTPFMELWNFVN
ncbi:agamous-like MADS-box protein AGL80 [Salvia divinorum]|uniref:Agamous-like MADS-box protein AGL80 n=1 Tax=Salvia divinorum TaxID=28513 RepID=A0ABD1G7S4_SALDI